MQARRARAAAQVAAANARDSAWNDRVRQIVAACIVLPVVAALTVCTVTAVLDPEPRAEAINRAGRLVSVSRSECASLARQWQRETDRVKRLEHATFYNLRSGCPETHGTMAQVLGVSR
ncbi:MAG: hypothetical protein OXR64_09870 [Chloroflexota bacterium]|nr:hypothetical protein [Chloroflexota bacterium]MDE2920139.1 hypothetical protein [Chloroflexota bacterium]